MKSSRQLPLLELFGLMLVLAPKLLADSPAQTEGSVKTWLTAYAKDQSNDAIEVVSFHKTNGTMGAFSGTPMYIMDFETIIRFKQTCRWKITPQFDSTLVFAVVAPQAQANTGNNPWGNFLTNSTVPGVSVTQGNMFKIVGRLVSLMSENGWVPKGIDESSIQPTTQ